MTGIAHALAPAPAPSPAASPAPASAGPGSSSAAGGKSSSFDDMLASDSTTAAAQPDAQPAVGGETGAEPARPPAADARPPAEPAPSAALPDQLLAMFGALTPMPAVGDVAAPAVVPPAPDADLGAGVMAKALRADAATALPAANAWTAGPGTGAAPAAAPAAAMAGAVKPEFAALLRDSAGPVAASGPDTSGIGGVLPAASASAPAFALQAEAVATIPGAVALPADPDAGFDDGFGSRIVWMAEQRLGQAEIRITPEHLGTIDVRLQLDGTKVSAEFFSAQPEVRQALEASFTRLRDMLGQQGLELAQADVGQQRPDSQPAAPEPASPDRDDAHDAAPAAAVVRGRRLLDEVA